jgi:superfamily II DNA or RNA helicase
LIVLPTGTGKTQVFLSLAEEYLRRFPNKKALVVAHREELIWQPATRWRDDFGGSYPAIEMGDWRVGDYLQGEMFGGSIDDRLILATIQTLTSGRRCRECTSTCPQCRGEGKTWATCKECDGQGCDECDSGQVKRRCVFCHADGWVRIRDDCNECFKGYKRRFLKFDPAQVSLVVIDEAHHAPADTYRMVAEYFGPEVKILGATATPDRFDEKALKQVFDIAAFEYDLPTAINDGWLVNIQQQYVRVKELDLSQVRSKVRDLNEGDVDAIIRQEEMLHRIITPTRELAKDQPCLVFMPGVDSAQRAAEILNRHKPDSAACIIGTTRPDVRKEEIRNYASGRRQYLVSCGVFLEGFDAPNTAVICMARFTKSRAVYAQAIGRGTRPLKGVVDGLATAEERRAAIAASAKQSLLVLDFVGNCGKHKLITTADILGGKYSDAVVAKAVVDMQKYGGPFNVHVALQKADDEERERLSKLAAMEAAQQRRQAELEAARRRQPIIASGATYSTTIIDPFDVFDLAPASEPAWFRGKLPSTGQIEALTKAGVDVPEGFTYWQADCILRKLHERREQGFCTYKQAKQLQRQGLSIDVTFEAASQVIDMIASNGWQPLQDEQLARALELCGASDAHEATPFNVIDSWTQSERARKPQGSCLPPTTPPNKTPRYFIKAGTPVIVTKIVPYSQHERPHQTKQDLAFERFETNRNGEYVFRHFGWAVRVNRGHVVHREDS